MGELCSSTYRDTDAPVPYTKPRMKVIIAAFAFCAIASITVEAGMVSSVSSSSSTKMSGLNVFGSHREFSVNCPGGSVKIHKALFGCLTAADEEAPDVTDTIQQRCADREFCEFAPAAVFGESWIEKCNRKPDFPNLEFQAWWSCSKDMTLRYWKS